MAGQGDDERIEEKECFGETGRQEGRRVAGRGVKDNCG